MFAPAAEDEARTRTISTGHLLLLLSPALLIIFLLFGGGLLLGTLQALGSQPFTDKSTLTFAHFTAVFADPDFATSFALTMYIATVSTLVAVIASVAIALALVRCAAANRVLNFFLQIPLTVPHLVIAISLLLLLSPTGILSRLFSFFGISEGAASFPLLVNDTYAVGILLTYIWKEIPFITFMILAVLKNSGNELNEVGRTLRANSWQRFRHITLPLIAPSLGAAGFIVFAFTFGAFEVPYLLGRTYPMVLPVWAYKNYTDIDLMARPEGIAIGLIIAAVVTCSLLLSQGLMQLARRQREYTGE